MDTRRYKINDGVDVLGTWYFIKTATKAEDPELMDCDGYCNYYAKAIVLREDTDTMSRIAYLKELIRHEITHAFMYESGLNENWEHKPFGQEETVVDWITIQHDKLHDAFEKVYAEIKEVAE